MKIIGGELKGRLLKMPKSDATRPTSGMLREALFNICQNFIEGAKFLDIFAGSGAIGLEALSRGASYSAFIDMNRECSQCIKENSKSLQVEAKTQVYQGEAIEMLALLSRRKQVFDIVYADPPYEQGISQELLNCLDELSILANDGVFFLEEAKKVKLRTDHLKTLQLKNSRAMGRATLYYFVKK